jgi:DNA invertase Pin-like site-specific DNA recombinase
MRNYCEREGWNVLGEYVDEGASAAKESALQRPEFRRMLDDAENHRIDVLVVHKLDRFSRNLSVTVQTLAKLDSWGADFVSLSEQIDPKTPMGRLMLKFMASLAEWYSDNLSTEIAKGRRERAEQGLPNGDLPFGYVPGPTAKTPPVPLESEAKLVKELFERYASGQYSFAVLADWINGCGVSPRSKRGKTAFTEDSVRGIVSNNFYRGVVKYRGAEKPGRHEPIVSDELWFLCERTRGSRRKKSSSVSPSRRRFTCCRDCCLAPSAMVSSGASLHGLGLGIKTTRDTASACVLTSARRSSARLLTCR